MFDENHFRVTIFGSARINREDKTYKDVFKIAKLIGSNNIDIVTGGGPGLMQAANAGHKEGSKDNESHSIGLNIKLPHEQDANPHLDIKHDFERFSGRLDTFMSLSNVVVVAPGGIGTILELFYTWQLVQVKHICNIPIILYGDMWPDLIKWMEKWPLKRKLINKKDLNNVFCAKNCKEAIEIIKLTKEQFDKGNKNVCLNIKKYTLNF